MSNRYHCLLNKKYHYADLNRTYNKSNKNSKNKDLKIIQNSILIPKIKIQKTDLDLYLNFDFVNSTYKRFLEYEKNKNKNVEKIKRKVNLLESFNCYYKPKINEKSQKLTSNIKYDSTDDFIDRQRILEYKKK